MPRRLVDVACGNGRNALSLANDGVDVVAFDHSYVALRIFAADAARRALSHPVRLVCASLTERLPFASSSFDGGLCLTAIENLITDQQLEQFVDELHRILRPNSLLLLYRLTQKDGFYAPRLCRTDAGALAFAEDVGIRQRIYSRRELERLLTPRLRILKTKYFRFTDKRGDATYMRSLEALVLCTHARP
jgi:SAM-dependent methyltransferase